jgi:hypothetical protein
MTKRGKNYALDGTTTLSSKIKLEEWMRNPKSDLLTIRFVPISIDASLVNIYVKRNSF